MFRRFVALVLGGALSFFASAHAEECFENPFSSCCPCWGYGINPARETTPCDLSVSLDFLILKSDIDIFSVFYGSSESPKGAALFGNTPDWDWGFKIALGKGWYCVPFETNLSWMHYQTKNTSSPQLTSDAFFIIVPDCSLFTSLPGVSADFDLHLHFNQLTLDIDREVLVGPKFCLRPALGVEYVDLRHNSSILIENVNGANVKQPITFLETFRNQLRGCGPSFALSSSFLMDCGLRIEAGLKGALLWTETHFSKNSQTDSSASNQVVQNSYQFNHNIVRPELIYSVNLTWMDQYSLCGPTFTLHAGWQGLFLFGSEETIFYTVNSKAFNLQGFLVGARMIF